MNNVVAENKLSIFIDTSQCEEQLHRSLTKHLWR